MAYWDINRILTHNAMVNLIVSTRGWGKTFGWKYKAIERFLKKGRQWFYTRRYMSEFENNDEYFKALQREGKFDNHKLEVHGDTYTVDGHLAGFSASLSRAASLKSSEYANVDFGCLDEFLLEPGSVGYLPNEVNTFFGLMETIDRGRNELIFFLLANSISITNPYFAAFRAVPPSNGIWKGQNGQVLIQTESDVDFINSRKESRLGIVTAGTKWNDYAYSNKFLLDSNTFIDKKRDSPKYWFTVSYQGYEFGVWEAKDGSRVWVSYDVDPSCYVVYTFSTKDHEPNTRLIKRASRSSQWAQFVQDYAKGFVFFEHVNIKNIFMDIIERTF